MYCLTYHNLFGRPYLIPDVNVSVAGLSYFLMHALTVTQHMEQFLSCREKPAAMLHSACLLMGRCYQLLGAIEMTAARV